MLSTTLSFVLCPRSSEVHIETDKEEGTNDANSEQILKEVASKQLF
jgi:hypothetical protein